MLHLDRLPRLRALSIAGAQEGNIICGGISPQLREVEISFSSGFSLSRILANLGPNLEEVLIYDCGFPQESLSSQSYPAMRRLSNLDSTSDLTAFASLELPLTSRLIVRINADDLEDLRAWPQMDGSHIGIPNGRVVMKYPDRTRDDID
jgi:hypothetical protein